MKKPRFFGEKCFAGTLRGDHLRTRGRRDRTYNAAGEILTDTFDKRVMLWANLGDRLYIGQRTAESAGYCGAEVVSVTQSGEQGQGGEQEEGGVKVAALYIDLRGPYPKMADVDCWDITRDARKYNGPWPVVAHPPCGPWGALRHLYDGDEHHIAPLAVAQVRKFGGVLEHPRRSLLWGTLGITAPRDSWTDAAGGWTVDVDQVDWGHVARKPTRLYLVGVDRNAVHLPAIRREPTHWASGGRHNKGGGSVPPGIKVCSAQQRRRTPPLFAEWLVSLARTVGTGWQES